MWNYYLKFNFDIAFFSVTMFVITFFKKLLKIFSWFGRGKNIMGVMAKFFMRCHHFCTKKLSIPDEWKNNFIYQWRKFSCFLHNFLVCLISDKNTFWSLLFKYTQNNVLITLLANLLHIYNKWHYTICNIFYKKGKIT